MGDKSQKDKNKGQKQKAAKGAQDQKKKQDKQVVVLPDVAKPKK